MKVRVLPQVAGRLNGVTFGCTAEALPFADRRDASQRPHPALRLDAVSAQSGSLAWRLKDAVLLNEPLKPHATGAKKSVPLNLSGEGSFSVEQSRLSGQWADLSAELFTSQLQARNPGHICGSSTGWAGLLVARPLEAMAAARVELAARDLSLKDFSLAALQPSSAKPSLPPLLRLASLSLSSSTLTTRKCLIHIEPVSKSQTTSGVWRGRRG